MIKYYNWIQYSEFLFDCRSVESSQSLESRLSSQPSLFTVIRLSYCYWLFAKSFTLPIETSKSVGWTYFPSSKLWKRMFSIVHPFCPRFKTMNVSLKAYHNRRSHDFVVNSTKLKVYNKGKWKVHQYEKAGVELCENSTSRRTLKLNSSSLRKRPSTATTPLNLSTHIDGKVVSLCANS